MKWGPGARLTLWQSGRCAAALVTLISSKGVHGHRRIMGRACWRRAAPRQRHRVIGRCAPGDDRSSSERSGIASRIPTLARLERLAFAKGLLLLGAGKSSLRLAPPLVVDEYDVDTALAIIDQCLVELS
jgi:4-aminobutyrate aminotransferase